MILSASAVNGYKITGTAEGTVSGDTVYLCDMQGFFSMIPVDTAVINKDGNSNLRVISMVQSIVLSYLCMQVSRQHLLFLFWKMQT